MRGELYHAILISSAIARRLLLEPPRDSCKLCPNIPGSNMNRIKPARIVLFVCVLAVIAIFIHSIQSRREKQAADAAEEVRQNAEREAAATKAIKDTTEATEQAAKTAATEHKNFLEKYVDTGITKKAASHMVAVAVTSETRAMNHAVAVALISHFKADHVQLTDSFFGIAK